jgi:predicted nucleic acid-binding Zn ribbon protein
MSYIVYDYVCLDCKATWYDNFVRRDEADKQTCEGCGGELRPLPPSPTTTFKFGDRSAQKGKKAVSLRDPNHGANSRGHSESLD